MDFIKAIKILFFLIIITISFWFSKLNNLRGTMEEEIKILPPKAKIIDHKFKIHDHEFNDEYNWMRDSKWPEKCDSRDVIEYLKSENEYSFQFFVKHKDLKKKILDELMAKIDLNEISQYIRFKDYLYFYRTYEDLEYPIYFRKLLGKNFKSEKIILDVNDLAEGRSFTKVAAVKISPNQNLLAYSVDFDGSENYKIYVKNLESDKNLPDIIEKVSPNSIIWHENLNGFFYVKLNENLRADKLYFHFLGTDSSEDILIFHESDLLNTLKPEISSSREYLLLYSSGHDSSEIYLLKMDSKNLNSLKKIIPRKDNIFYEVDHGGDYFYIHTNDKGDNFRLARVLEKDIDVQKSWEDYISVSENLYMESFDITKNYIIVNYIEKGLTKIDVIDIKTSEKKNVIFKDEAYSASAFSTNFEDDDIRISYSSLKMPSVIYLYEYATNSYSIIKETIIPSGFNSDEYQVERVWADNDGIKIPISLFYKKSLFKKNGSNPLYLYGYGSYGIAIKPSFKISAVTLADRGFVYAIAHIRGGDDLGHDWYQASKFLNKKRTFSDFISSVEFLIENNYTSKGNIAIMGGSAGGMLVGNVINQKPEYFKAAIAHVPFVDVLNTMLDETLPLTPGEFKEWGNPKEKEYFDYILSYCPYQNVKSQNYPNLFVTAGITDPRVGYWEAAKWVAKLRSLKTDDNLIIFKTNMQAGHSGSSARIDYMREVADDYVFLFSVFGINK